RLPLKEYLQIVAASNFKQRSRMCMLYYHAERLNWAVIGTGNKNEHEQGFFVKYGDGGADVKPIAHLFKTQVFQLAEYLGVPKEIQSRTPTTDTYSAEQTQEEFFFRLPFETLDRIWHGWEHNVPVEEIAAALELQPGQVENVIHDVKRKIAATEYLRMNPL
ncbi:MAG TPA: NAD(+) synthase, partial [Calditrichaeota bacterium]|nr:NAD(+) synthase [Calditrichota bacterium]